MSESNSGRQDVGYESSGGVSRPSLLAVTRPNIGLLVEVGKQRRKQIKRLKRGDGRLKAQILAALDSAREELGIDRSAEIVPVVILYRYADRDRAVSHTQD